MIQAFENHPFQENTYIIVDETGDCAIIDPGMHTANEQNAVANFIKENGLRPTILLNTHCHIDHVLGNKFIFDMYGLKPYFHANEQEVLEYAIPYAQAAGLNYEPLHERSDYLPETGIIQVGDDTEFEILFVPGHAPGHVCFYNRKENYVIGGDVLFRGSIGRTDLPGGDYKQLIRSIRNQLMVLPDDCEVYPGHGPKTTIGYEMETNPFLNL
ncbi:MAG: MBL fold metallo-hydrolase [Mucilaginibacter sp.]